ncbi:MAG: radical SAM protein [Nanoarchaeota archaeon]|nr:radical SAM protein [Nanoarchaeota archaeon]MBU1644308.1 radical SAM protein [Nanoarchaeota archaeon]MBU1976355.1 radical SAM protein [Nanoarchaeota archaeon]
MSESKKQPESKKQTELEIKVPENKYYSYNLGQLPKGCRYCVKGEKLVLFITGECPRRCYFCPVSDQKYQKDVIFANERSVKDFEDVVKEAEAMDAKGAGITGGDPLARLERTVEFIRKLKERFGKEFHIHLYTSLDLVNSENLKQLFQAGLDEIRFHLDFESKKLWDRIELAKEFDWDLGVEIPLIPNKEKELKELIDFIHDKVKFLNLNELEVADNEQSKLLKMGLKTKDEVSYAVEKSLELGLSLIEYVKKKEYQLSVHLCTAKLKDAIQLGNRLKREAEVSKNKFDLVDEEGMLIRGALYLKELAPDFGYRKKLEEADKEQFVQLLKPLYDRIKKKFKLDDEEIMIDEKKPRILLSKRLVKKKSSYFASLGLRPAIVVEYPTANQLEIEVEFLG